MSLIKKAAGFTIGRISKVKQSVEEKMYYAAEGKGNINTNKISQDTTITHVCCHKVDNVGDTVLAQCVRKTFEYFMPVNWNLSYVRDEVTQQSLETFNRTKAVVVGGGGLFLPDTNKNVVSGWQWSIPKEYLGEIKCPLMIYSVGYNYFPGQEPSGFFCENLAELCRNSAFFGLRNYGSINKVKELLPEELREKVVYQPCTTTLIRKIYGDAVAPKTSSRKVAINMAFDRMDRRFGEDKELILKQISVFAKNLTERGYEVILVYHTSGDQRMRPYFNAENFRYTEKYLVSSLPDEVLEFYNSVDLVLGMRGHAQMIPFGLNCEIISMGTHDKMRYFLEDIDALDWYVNLRENPEKLSETLMEKFIHIHETDSENTKRRLVEAQEKLWAVTVENMKAISEFMQG